MATSYVHQEMLSQAYVTNSKALATLTREHGVVLKPFPDTVLDTLGHPSKEVLRETAGKDPLSKELIDSALVFRAKAQQWTMISEYGYLTARQRVLM